MRDVLCDLLETGCSVLTLGQYLQPGPGQLPVDRYVTPEEFDQWGALALSLGFRHVESGPLVRSSYHAARQAESVNGDSQDKGFPRCP